MNCELLHAAPTLQPARLHQAVVVAREQVAFNLLKRIKHHAHQDEQRRTAKELRKLVANAQLHGKGRHNCH